MLSLILIALMVPVTAKAPNVMSYRGMLTDHAGQQLNDTKLIKLIIYGSPFGDDSLWSSSCQGVSHK